MTLAKLGFDKSLWAATAEPDIRCPALTGRNDGDVTIVGGGFTGLSTALHLSNEGFDVTIIEAETIGYGASGRNGGQVNPGWKLWPREILAVYGETRGQEILKMLSGTCDLVFDLISRHDINCALRHAPYLRAASKKRGLAEVEKWVQEWGELGMPVELLDRQKTQDLLGSDFFNGGFTDARGGSLQPLSYARGLARAAIASGVKIYCHSPASKITREGSDWVVKTNGGRLKTRYLVLATNGYTGKLWPGLARQVVPVGSLIAATKPLPEKIRQSILPQGHHVSDTRRRMVYFKIDETGRFLIGGRGQLVSPTKQYDDTSHLQAEAIRLYPQLAHVDWDYSWGGLVAMTTNHRPYLLELGPNAYAGLGFNGRGIAMATMMGKLIAQNIMGHKSAMLPEKPSPIALHAFRNLGVAWYMFSGKILDALEK